MKSRRQLNDKVSTEKKIEEFGNRAEAPTSSTQENSKASFKRYTFSLTEEVSKSIDQLTLTTARISRSDVVKAGVDILSTLSTEELKKIFEKK